MSGQATSCAVRVRGISPTEKLVLLVLANYADQEMQCWPSQKRIAEEACLSERSVRNALTSLEERRLISRAERFRPNGSQTTDHITMHFHGELWGGEITPMSGAARPSAQGRQLTTERAATAAALTSFDPPVNHQKEESSLRSDSAGAGCDDEEAIDAEPIRRAKAPSGQLVLIGEMLPAEPKAAKRRAKDEDTPEFQRFWAAFPNPVGKGDARKAFPRALQKAAKLGDPVEVMLAGIERYIAAKPPDRSWCNPSTWLNQERWLDEHRSLTVHNHPAGLVPSGDRRLQQMVGGAAIALDRIRRREGGG